MDLLEQHERLEMAEAFQDSLRKIAVALFPRPAVQAHQKTAAAPADWFGEPTLVKRACARELLTLNAVSPEQALVMEKASMVSEHEAQRSLDRLDTLERNKPTGGQVARYGAVGGLGGAAIGALGNAIEHGSALRGDTPKAKALNLAANAVKGGLGGGALPLLRTHLDRRAEMGTLRRFMQQPVEHTGA